MLKELLEKWGRSWILVVLTVAGIWACAAAGKVDAEQAMAWTTVLIGGVAGMQKLADGISHGVTSSRKIKK